MKRMKPEQYKQLAASRFAGMRDALLCSFGAWNASKIKSEIERLLREERYEQRRLKTSDRQVRKSHRARKAHQNRAGFVSDTSEVSGQA